MLEGNGPPDPVGLFSPAAAIADLQPAAPTTGWRASTLPVVLHGSRLQAALPAGVKTQRFFRLYGLHVQAASFVRQEVPRQIIAGDFYTARVTMHNTSQTTWLRDGPAALQHALGSQNPVANRTWDVNRVPLPVSTVAPGEEMTIPMIIRTPMVPGRNYRVWHKRQGADGGWSSEVFVRQLDSNDRVWHRRQIVPGVGR